MVTEKAKEKLAEAGYPDGIDLVFKAASDSWYNNPAQVIVEELRQVGIRCDFQTMERAPFIEAVHNKMDYDLSSQTLTSRYGLNIILHQSVQTWVTTLV